MQSLPVLHGGTYVTRIDSNFVKLSGYPISLKSWRCMEPGAQQELLTGQTETGTLILQLFAGEKTRGFLRGMINKT